MWLPNNDEFQYFKHYERDLRRDFEKRRFAAPTRIFAAKNQPGPVQGTNWPAAANAFLGRCVPGRMASISNLFRIS
jgi:hypothetical protein